MIYKSYLVENNYDLIKNVSSALFYGENIGLKKTFKTQLKSNNKNSLFISFSQDEVIKNETILIRELENSSLFGENKIIFLEDCNDKILNILEPYLEKRFNFQTIIFAGVLEKKSKLRATYEKSKIFPAIACYPDNEISIEKIIQNKLRGFQGLSRDNINMIIEACVFDRVRLENEIEKIITFFSNKKIETETLAKLLNNPLTDNFNDLKDEAMKGNKLKTNNLLSTTVIEVDKVIFYLSIINQRLIKLDEINYQKEESIEKKIQNLKPPVFWKDKPNLISQLKKWKPVNIKKAMNNIYKLEIKIRSNSTINKDLMIKKLMVDICDLANA